MKSKRKNIIKMYFKDKLKPTDIAKVLKISNSAVTQVLQQDKRYNEEKQRRKIVNKNKHLERTKQ